MAAEGTSSVRLRSIYVSPPYSFPIDSEAQDGIASTRNVVQAPLDGGGSGHKFNDQGAAEKESADPLHLPESSHSLLFTESVWSLPFWFAAAIAALSCSCLGLAFAYNISDGTKSNPFAVPVNISTSVRIAQYLSVVVALLMEEEIPTGLYLLREITEKDFRKRLSGKKYRSFVLAAVVRLLSGYFFLINVFLILIQANGVIEIFYDVMALQFVQQLDDIAFNLSKINVLGNRMQRACTAPPFKMEFEKQKVSCRKSEVFLRTLYFLNFCALMAGMIVVSVRQDNGYYQCKSISVTFGDDVWKPAMALNITSGKYEEWTLAYSYFNGVYEREGNVYKERRKFDRASYDENSVVPAEIRYCKEINSWVFTHPLIRKSIDEVDGCNWLIRSAETSEFDLLKVEGSWKIWTGVIGTTEVVTACNMCSDKTDCNLNGQCVDGECKCRNEAGVQHLGIHCEIRLSDSCKTIIGEGHNEIFSVDYHNASPNGDEPLALFQEYSRPVYKYVGPYGDEYNVTEYDKIWLTFTGNRWFGMKLNSALQSNTTAEDLVVFTREFHAFWDRAYSTVTLFVSDATEVSTPVNVDWYEIGERGSQFGPFGALNPVQLNQQTGRGYFRCAGSYIPPKRYASATDRSQYQKLPGN